MERVASRVPQLTISSAASSVRAILVSLAMLGVACGGRPFAEGGSRELTIVTQLPADSPEILLLRAIVEREAIRIENESAYQVRFASASDPRVYRARTILVLGYGSPDRIPAPLAALKGLLPATGAPFVFSPDVWLRGQAVGLFWTEDRDDLLPALQQYQNRLFEDLDRATFGTVRVRLLSLPHDTDAERRLRSVAGYTLRVPRGYEVRIDPATRAALLVDEGPPTRLLRVMPTANHPEADLVRTRNMLARAFRPNERTLDVIEPTLTPSELAGATREIHGRWEDSDVSAAGPYRFYEMVRRGRHFYVDLAVFAPGRPKLPYLRELMAIAETLSVP